MYRSTLHSTPSPLSKPRKPYINQTRIINRAVYVLLAKEEKRKSEPRQRAAIASANLTLALESRRHQSRRTRAFPGGNRPNLMAPALRAAVDSHHPQLASSWHPEGSPEIGGPERGRRGRRTEVRRSEAELLPVEVRVAQHVSRCTSDPSRDAPTVQGPAVR